MWTGTSMDFKDLVRHSLDHVGYSALWVLDVVVSIFWECLTMDLDASGDARKVVRDGHCGGPFVVIGAVLSMP